MDASIATINNFDSFKDILNYGLIENSIQQKHVYIEITLLIYRVIYLTGFNLIRIFTERCF